MTQETVELLSEVLKKFSNCTLCKASRDDTNHEAMCDSRLQVIDFDKIPNEYARGRGWDGVPKSNDALYIDIWGKWYFIEFKNGSEIHKDEVYRKLYDSLIMLLEWKIIPDFEFIRNNINYILVYNEGKHDKIPKAPARDLNYGYFFERAQKEKRLWGIDKFEKYLFSETHTYTKNEFEEKFVRPKEIEEGIAPS